MAIGNSAISVLFCNRKLRWNCTGTKDNSVLAAASWPEHHQVANVLQAVIIKYYSSCWTYWTHL